MQQIKIFKSVESEIESLEAEINSWLRKSGVKMTNIIGNIAPQTATNGGGAAGIGAFSASDILIIVTYETTQ